MVFKKGYFDLYCLFLQIDTLYSLIEGRNRELILCFQNLFFAMLSNNKDNKELRRNKNKLVDVLSQYCLKHGFDTNSNDRIGAICFADRENILSESCKHYYDSVTLYAEWRAVLSHGEQKHIYQANIKDRLEYYFNKNDFFSKNLEVLFDNSNLKNGAMSISRQSLSEFHNAMSHLCKAYTFPTQSNEYNTNIIRACNHLQRGALDTYKIIIKDYWLLSKCPKNDLFYNDFLNLRKQEYENIGCDNKRLKLLSDYNLLVESIMQV